MVMCLSLGSLDQLPRSTLLLAFFMRPPWLTSGDRAAGLHGLRSGRSFAMLRQGHGYVAMIALPGNLDVSGAWRLLTESSQGAAVAGGGPGAAGP